MRGSRSKGNSSCHIPNDVYRENYERIFKKSDDVRRSERVNDTQPNKSNEGKK